MLTFIVSFLNKVPNNDIKHTLVQALFVVSFLGWASRLQRLSGQPEAFIPESSNKAREKLSIGGRGWSGGWGA